MTELAAFQPQFASAVIRLCLFSKVLVWSSVSRLRFFLSLMFATCVFRAGSTGSSQTGLSCEFLSCQELRFDLLRRLCKTTFLYFIFFHFLSGNFLQTSESSGGAVTPLDRLVGLISRSSAGSFFCSSLAS